ncbi:hypothetical protein MGN70_000539 [Eutypa lata]|uniref:Biogenesis of lysosome-related organelles complex 1 subunit KXD1 n=1 Tax=Eutypa lata (strain UCR-EL1) TaxID=1287681 RepID=M7TLV9_EUTLA|nr:hypothetical protein UCREL1_5299 [Eutypa lata UCREL1]KAI1257497.1 hypothetical protein MGN70_000539 [Eutypa lata]
MATYTPQYYAASSGAVAIPTKGPSSCSGYQSGGSTYSASPPEDNDASVTSGVPSYGHGSSTAGYTTGTTDSSGSDYYYSSHHHHQQSQNGGSNDHHNNGGGYYYQDGVSSAASASGVDFNEYIQDRFADSFDPIPLDRSLAVQAQTSGQLNAKHRELLELQAKAQARLARSRARFQEGLQDAQEVRANLEWTSKKVSSLKKKAEKKHSKEYKKARERYPSPEY